MIILPAIDLYEKKAVRLYKGDYENMTVYSENPLRVAEDFRNKGASWIHMVDLEGAKDGTVPNLDIVKQVAQETGLLVEIGGGIRSIKTAEKYFEAGVSRIILGTAAVNDEAFLKTAVGRYGSAVAVGADIKDGYVAIKGWLEKSSYTLRDFMKKMQKLGVETVICTDISRDGAMKGTNLRLYSELSAEFSMNIIASGGVSSMKDIRELKKMDIYGAILGKAYYTGAVDLGDAIEEAEKK